MALTHPLTSAERPSAPTTPGFDKAKLQALKARLAVGAEGERVTVKIPFTGAVLDTLPNCTTEDIAAAVTKARAAGFLLPSAFKNFLRKR